MEEKDQEVTLSKEFQKITKDGACSQGSLRGHNVNKIELLSEKLKFI